MLINAKLPVCGKKNYQEKQNYFSFRQMPSSVKNPNKPYLCYIELG